ncbi:MAG: hypothetical protein M1812_006778 [Candelaria pacifica]|nr:MAG: hypothetical protein M1812_006778 [Candelaria pacifica]
MVRLGVHSLGPNLIWDGALYYGKALRRLNDNLQDSSLFLSPANVAASFLLGIYELSAFENGSGWIRHAGGVGKLIEMRGAEFFRESPAREYFIVSRLPIISEALALRRRCFLDQEDWKTIPWLDEPRLKTSLHSVIDLLACVPRLREESDILKVAKADISSVPVREFCERLVNLMAELFLWRWRYERAFPGTAFEVASSEATSTREESASDVAEYPTILFYKHFHVARQPMLYNISLLMILDLATVWDLADTPTQALRRLPNEERPLQASNALVLPHEALTQEEILHEICRSLEFHLRGPHAAARGMVLLLPLRIAFTYVKDERQRAWLDQIVKRVSRTCGFRFSERVADTRSFAED